MSILDELREELYANLSSRGLMEAAKMAQVLDRFEAAHPGLVDASQICPNCGEPWTGRYWDDGSADSRAMLESGWKYVESCDRITPVWNIDDNDIWLVCPTCAKEAR